MNIIVLLRGVSGSGKSTFARVLGGKHYEADMFFVDSDGVYKFNPKKLKEAHKWCHSSVELSMSNREDLIVVSNTFTQEWEMEDYYKLAETYGYRVHSFIVENRHFGENVHGVPPEKLEAMAKRFEVKL